MSAHDRLIDSFVVASRALIGLAVHSVNAAPVDITVTQYRVLVLVAQADRNIGDIAAHLGVNQSSASRHCDRLQRLGLVSRTRSEADARVVCVALTEEGRALIAAVTAQRRRDVARLLEAVEIDDAQAVVRALDALNDAANELDDAPWVRDPW